MNLIRAEVSNDYELYTIDGQVNYENIKDLSPIRYSNTPTLIINLANCTFLDSTAVGFFIIVHKARERNKQKLILKAINPNLLDKLQATNLIKILNIIP